MFTFFRKLFGTGGTLPSDDPYQSRVDSEKRFYADCENVHDLPDIFHYWSNKFLSPEMQRFGFNGPDAFFLQQTQEKCVKNPVKNIRVISIGAGNCDVETVMAQKLLQQGLYNFSIECLELNEEMIARGKSNALELQVEKYLRFTQSDFNHWQASGQPFDVIMANQSLHHVVALEHLFSEIHAGLADDGVFLISDMIGRNGHLRWPEAREAMQPFWEELPVAYRYNRLLERDETVFLDNDCSTSGFEGIRAQDILPLLCERFDFEFFFPYGNIIFPFIDRAFGHNFDASSERDRNLIDRIHERDEQGLLSGELTPSSMLAVVVKHAESTRLRDPRLSPRACIRTVDR